VKVLNRFPKQMIKLLRVTVLPVLECIQQPALRRIDDS
jgi:hypothetical protein